MRQLLASSGNMSQPISEQESGVLAKSTRIEDLASDL